MSAERRYRIKRTVVHTLNHIRKTVVKIVLKKSRLIKSYLTHSNYKKLCFLIKSVAKSQIHKMRITTCLLLVVITLAMFLTSVASTPVFFNKLFGSYGNSGYNNGYSSGGYSRGYSGGYGGFRPSGRPGRGRSYNDICRVVSPVNYPGPGRVAAPFCPNN